MFWDIIIQADTHIVVFIVSVNVLFLSNSQHCIGGEKMIHGVYRKCQCPLFKQFTTLNERWSFPFPVFIVSVNVLFFAICNWLIMNRSTGSVLNNQRFVGLVGGGQVGEI